MADFLQLLITDGTTTVDLFSDAGDIKCTKWVPATAEPKGGGTWQDSALDDGRQLSNRKANNVVETFTLNVKGLTQDVVIRATQELRRLLQKGADYWTTEWATEPVYLVAKAAQETNTRYALVMDYRLPSDADIIAAPFWSHPSNEKPGMVEIQLLVEREPFWRDVAPGTGTGTSLSAVQGYNGINLGNVDAAGARQAATGETVFSSNKHNTANLTHIFYYDASVPSYSANLLTAALPTALLPAVPAVGDLVLFGCDTTVGHSGPFCNLVFDVGNVGANITTIVWEYWNGGAWAALTVQDNTNADGLMTGRAFDTLGVKSVHWEQPSDWATLLANGVTAYWVRARVTVVGGGPTPPQQQNRDIYSVPWGYTEVQADDVGGDVPALLRIKVHNQSDHDGAPGSPALPFTDLLIGLRSVSRGSNFRAWLNAADEQNPNGMTVTDGGVSAFANDARAPSGRKVTCTNIAGFSTLVTWQLNAPLIAEYYGTYQFYVRVDQTSGAANVISLRVNIRGSGIPINRSQSVAVNSTALWHYVYLGKFTLPPSHSVGADSLDMLSIALEGSGDGAADMDVFDMFLLPVDEWAADLRALDPTLRGSFIGARNVAADRVYMDIDGIMFPKANRVLTRYYASNYVTGFPQYIANGKPIFQANARQRLWTMAYNADARIAKPYITNTLEVYRAQRYQSARGDR